MQVRELCITIWKDLNSSRNVWGILSSALESVLARGTPGEAAAQEQQWTRTTLATGFSVKRAGINPGAPGFVYPFYPHKRMRRADTPPHLLGLLLCPHPPPSLAPSCSLWLCRRTLGLKWWRACAGVS